MKLLLLVSILSLLPMTSFAESDAVTEENHEVILSDEATAQAHYNYNFGRVRVGRSESATFTLRNQGRLPVYINDINLKGDDAFHDNDNCPSLLFRGQSCRIRVTFRPHDTGRYEGELEVNLTGASDVSVDLRGRGVDRRF